MYVAMVYTFIKSVILYWKACNRAELAHSRQLSKELQLIELATLTLYEIQTNYKFTKCKSKLGYGTMVNGEFRNYWVL